MTTLLDTSDMNVWLWAATVLMLALIPAGIVCFRGAVEDRVAGLEFGSLIITLCLAMMAEGFHQPSFFDLPLALAILTFGAGLVFARFLQRWL